MPASTAAAMVSSASPSSPSPSPSRSSPVNMRMQPRPMRNSEARSQSEGLRRGSYFPAAHDSSADHDGDDLLGPDDAECRPGEIDELAGEPAAAGLERVQLGLG